MKNASETVLVTGASSGIGLELARTFAEAGCRLVLVSRRKEILQAIASELEKKHGVEVAVFACDLARPNDSLSLFNQVRDSGWHVDVLVNNAGFGLMGEFTQLALDRQMEMVQVNVASLVHLTHLFLPAMLERRQGGIINVGSVAGFLPGPNMAVYYATKAFVLSFTEALAAETAGSGVRVSVLCPGPTESNFGQVARGGRPRKRERKKMDGQKVAQAGVMAYQKGRVIAVPGWSNQWLVQSTRFLPRWLVRAVVSRYNRF